MLGCSGIVKLVKVPFVLEILLIMVKLSDKVSRSPRYLMLKKFIQAWPRRMEKFSIHVDVHDAVSILKFGPRWSVFKAL